MFQPQHHELTKRLFKVQRQSGDVTDSASRDILYSSAPQIKNVHALYSI